MADYKKTAEGVLAAIGGAANVTFATHCVTRLRFNLADQALVDRDAVRVVPGVLGEQYSGEQYQVIIGPTVTHVYNEVCEVGGIEHQAAVDENLDPQASAAEKRPLTPGRIGSAILDALTGCLTPVIPMLVAGGLVKLILMILGPSALGLVQEGSDLFKLLTFVGDAGFYFLPMAVAYTGSKKFGSNTVISVFIAGIMLHPTLAEIVATGKPFTVYGIPMWLTAYGSTVFPMILITAVQAQVEKLLNRIIPDQVHLLFVPVLTVLAMTPVALCVLGPCGAIMGVAIQSALMWVHNVLGPVGIALIGALFMPLVATGMHLPIIVLGMSTLATQGYENVIFVMGAASTFASIACGLGFLIKAKTAEDRELGLSCFITQAVVGVGEPTIFGILLRYPRVLAYQAIGTFVGTLYAAIMGVTCYAPLYTNFTVVLEFIGGDSMANFVHACISGGIGFVVTLALIMILGVEGNKKRLS